MDGVQAAQPIFGQYSRSHLQHHIAIIRSVQQPRRLGKSSGRRKVGGQLDEGHLGTFPEGK